MPRDGSGNYTPPLNSWNPAVNSAAALPQDWMAILNDLSNAIQNSLAADGQTKVAGHLDFSGHRARGLGAPVGQGDVLRLQQIMRGSDIASAQQISIPIEGSFFLVTGTTTIEAIGGSVRGRGVLVQFGDELTIKNSANLLLPGGADIVTQAGDYACFVCLDGTIWACWFYPRIQIDKNLSDILGTAAYLDTGTGPDELPKNSDLSSGAYAEIKEEFDQFDDSDKNVVSQRFVTMAVGVPGKTGTTLFTRTSNNISHIDIVPSLQLEAGDVILIENTTKNDGLYTVEVITNDSNIIVNEAHKNGAGPLSLTLETANTCTIKRLSKWYNAPPGLGQAWVDMTSSRSSNISYQPPYARGIEVSISWAKGAGNKIEVNSGLGFMQIAITDSATSTNRSEVAGQFGVSGEDLYRANLTGGEIESISWLERR